MRYFLDTNICIFFLNETYANVSETISLMPTRDIALPSMTIAELLFGAYNSARREQNMARLDMFIPRFRSYGFDKAAAEAHARIRVALKRDGAPIGYNDLIIAATVIANRGVLVTNNTREFSRVPGLAIEDWSA